MGKRTKSRCKHQNDRDKVSETDCGGGLGINCLKVGEGKRAGTKGIRLSVEGRRVNAPRTGFRKGIRSLSKDN